MHELGTIVYVIETIEKLAEEEKLPVLAVGSKTGDEKSLENPGSVTIGKVNPKWS